ncbi:MAG TPA: hypothetical protein VGO91_15740 [Pyrinomonadaceae bacterium]|jgi:hypothetical protein|nr:hypothetical protein [Pyrinomonadaceae bacterium]
MLFLANKELDHDVNDEARLPLLVRLQEKGMVPLIRSTRLSCYEAALSDSQRAGEMERLVALQTNLERRAAYVRGDIFCFDDYVFFLIFGDHVSNQKGTRAGIVYEQRTAEPLRKLDSFCQTVSLCLADVMSETGGSSGGADETMKLTAWRQDWSTAVHQGFMRFIASQDVDSLYRFTRTEWASERVRAAALLEDDHTRYFLRCVKEASGEGHAVGLQAAGKDAPAEFLIKTLIEAGLLGREVLISCRKTEHMLFTIPSSDALATLTISEAKCSECGVKIVDEKIEEVVAPTQLAHGLLENGAWLVNRIRIILRELGVPDSEVALEPPTGEGEARLMVNLCGEPFLLVLRDGDLTPAFARRAVDIKINTAARHLVVVVTGTVHQEGRLSLMNFARRLTRSGSDFELIIGEGIGAAASELQRAFERVSQKVLGEQLCELDDSLGSSAALLLTIRFQLLRQTEEAATNTTARLSSIESEPTTALQSSAHAPAR